VPFDSLRAGYNVDPKTAGVDFLSVWRGGKWGIGDIVRYQTGASWALLAQTADDRAQWLSSYARVQRNAMLGNRASGREDWPSTIVIPAQPARDTAVNAALRILQRGQVEVRRASAGFTAGGKSYPAGSLLIHTAQPYGAFAKALLEVQTYPNLREYPGGPPKRPYDVTAHTLPLLYGFAAAFVRDSVAVASDPLPPVRATPWVARGLTGAARRRVALYRSFSPVMDEGWTRWVLDQHRIPYTIVTPVDVRAGRLRGRFDALVVPDQSPRLLAGGPPQRYPDSLRVGLGAEGAPALAAFVEGGGTLVTFNEASRYAIDALSLPVRDVAAGLKPTEFYAPGSLFRLALDRRHPLAANVTAPEPAAWFEEGPLFEITDPARATAVGPLPGRGRPAALGVAARRRAGARRRGAGRSAAGARPGGAVRLPPAVSGAEPGYLPPRLERAPRPLTGATLPAWRGRGGPGILRPPAALPAGPRPPPLRRHRPINEQAHRDQLDLAGWGVHSLGRRDRARAQPLAAVRLGGLRGDPLLQHPARAGDLPARGPPAAPGQLVQDVPHGAALHGGRAGRRLLRARRAQRARRLLHPPDGDARLRRRRDGADGEPVEVYLPCWPWGVYLGEGALEAGVGRLRVELEPDGARTPSPRSPRSPATT
jgi:hypothetical protein